LYPTYSTDVSAVSVFVVEKCAKLIRLPDKKLNYHRMRCGHSRSPISAVNESPY